MPTGDCSYGCTAERALLRLPARGRAIGSHGSRGPLPRSCFLPRGSQHLWRTGRALFPPLAARVLPQLCLLALLLWSTTRPLPQPYLLPRGGRHLRTSRSGIDRLKPDAEENRAPRDDEEITGTHARVMRPVQSRFPPLSVRVPPQRL